MFFSTAVFLTTLEILSFSWHCPFSSWAHPTSSICDYFYREGYRKTTDSDQEPESCYFFCCFSLGSSWFHFIFLLTAGLELEERVNSWSITILSTTTVNLQDSATFTFQPSTWTEHRRMNICANIEMKRNMHVLILQAHKFPTLYSQQFLWLIRVKSKCFLVWAWRENWVFRDQSFLYRTDNFHIICAAMSTLL